MTGVRQGPAAAWIAAFTATALVLQALLISFASPAARAAAAIEVFSVYALCSGSVASLGDPAAPAPIRRHAGHDCCILCAVPGLAAGSASSAFAAPAWDAGVAAPRESVHARDLAPPAERSPVNPRAPPA